MFSMFAISLHHTQDIALYVVFFIGQLVYMIKRAGFSMRAGRCKNRRSFFYQNWDILLFRTVLELCVVFMPVTHFSIADILSWFHVDISGISMLKMLQTPVGNPLAILFTGIASDGLFDWLVDFVSRSPKVPDALKKWLSENADKPNGGH